MSGDTKLRLLISDIDGTLVRSDKTLSNATVMAVRALTATGLPMTLISARPPSGMLWIAERLGLPGPFGAFNGGVLFRHDGSVIELIRPGAKPSSSGADWNWRSVAVETLDHTGAPDYAVTGAQLEELAQMIAWLATFDGRRLDGIPVSFRIDREHVISHQETWSGTECPGPYLQARLDDIVSRARQIFTEKLSA